MPKFTVLEPPYNVDLSFTSSEFFAVRSSFSAEDGENHSFAGQFCTELNVKREDVQSAVKKVAASVENAKDYTSAHKKVQDGDMRVIVQEMILAEYSGVIFTANPQGLLNEMVLTVGAGTGNLVVEDKTPTATHYYNVADKVYYSELSQNAPDLHEDIIVKLFKYAEKIQECFGFYADIEFSILGDAIYFLQVRHITTIDDTHKIILDSSNIRESYPGITLPCSQSFASAVYESAFLSCVNILSGSSQLLGGLDEVLKNMVQCANGRMYYRIGNWYSLLKILPFSRKIIPVWQEMLGVCDKDMQGTKHINHSFLLKLKISQRFIYYMFITPKKMRELDEFFAKTYSESKDKVRNTTDSAQLFTIYKNILNSVGSRWGITLINDMYAFIYTALAKKKHGDKLNNISKLESLKPVIALDALAKIKKESTTTSEQYKKARAEYLREFGDRGLEELKLETRTMNTNHEIFDAYFQNYLNSDITVEQHEESANAPADSYFLKCAKQGIFNRERSRMNRTRLYGIAREIFDKIGENFKTEGILANATDIYYLYIDEIENCINDKKSMAELALQRKTLYEELANLPAYTRLVYMGEIFDKVPHGAKKHSAYSSASTLHGTPCSSGVVRGTVLVVDKPSLSTDTRGKILVADITDPGWVFLIKNAKGIIAQKGSLLSHTAIITRELKKPSIVGVQGAMSMLKTGDTVEMDGSTGAIIKIT